MLWKFFALQLFDVKFLFSEKIDLLQAEENGCYRRTSMVSVIKCNSENDDLFEA